MTLIGTVRVMLGAVAGGAVAGMALRARRLAHQRDVPMSDVVADLPEIIRHDLSRLIDAGRDAVTDGRSAARRKEAEIDRVLAESRHAGRQAPTRGVE